MKNEKDVKQITGLAKSLLHWMNEGTAPQSIVIKQGIYLATRTEHDGIDVNFVRPQLAKFDVDMRIVKQIMDALNKAGADRVKVMVAVLDSVWQKKKPRVENKKTIPNGKPITRKPNFKKTHS